MSRQSDSSSLTMMVILLVIGAASWWYVSKKTETTLGQTARARAESGSGFVAMADDVMGRWKTDSDIAENEQRFNAKLLDLAKAEREVRAYPTTIATRQLASCFVAGLGDTQTALVNFREGGVRAGFDQDMAIVHERMGACGDLLARIKGQRP